MKSRGTERDFNADLAEAMRKWKEAYDAFYDLAYGYEWEPSEEAMRKHLADATRFMLSVKTAMRKLARARADMSQPQQ